MTMENQIGGLPRNFSSFNYEHAISVLNEFVKLFHEDSLLLLGNTAESDIEWLARQIWLRDNHVLPAQWRDWPEASKDRYKRLAEICVQSLQPLTERIAGRYVSYAKMLKLFESQVRAER